MSDGWVVHEGKNTKRQRKREEKQRKLEVGKKSKGQQNKSQNSKKRGATVDRTGNEPKPAINEAFLEDVSIESNDWTVITNKKRNKKQQAVEVEEEPEIEEDPAEVERKKQERKEAKKARKVKQREKKDEEDELRARKALEYGSPLKVYDPASKKWLKAKIIASDAEGLTLEYREGSDTYTRKESRLSDQIQLHRDPKTNLYLPLPEEVTTTKVSPEKTKSTKKKKKKKKSAPKLQTEEELIKFIYGLLSQRPLNTNDLANFLKDQLVGGSWNSKKYKGRFGSLKNFLKKYPQKFLIEEKNGNIEVTRVEPKVTAKKERNDENKKRTTKKPKESSDGEFSIFALILLLLIIGGSMYAAFFLQDADNRNEFLETLRGILDKVTPKLKEEI